MQPTPASRPIQNPIIRWLVYSHVWLALGAAAQVWWTYMYLADRSSELRLVSFTFFGTLSAYGFMRLMRAKGPLAEVVPLFNWVDRHRRLQWIMVVITGAIALWAILPLASRLIGILWWVIPVCILYVLPFGYPKRYFGLRAIPVIKVPIVGVVWMAVTVVLPLRAEGLVLHDTPAIFLMLQRVLLVMALTIAFDIRDSFLDPRRLRTLPQMIGDRGARWVAVSMLTVSVVILVFLHGFEPRSILNWALALPLIGFAYSIWLVAKADRSRPEIFYGFTIDGMLILIPVLAWLGRSLF